ncbi:aldo/keto reductase [Actinomadura alba]|uniref:aldo/keto reductase n=1 Tax=Actinomadura alba TaxID=406431 RepID=UPI001650CA64|nr:aldo/keto reductase [Actinomadura alba]
MGTVREVLAHLYQEEIESLAVVGRRVFASLRRIRRLAARPRTCAGHAAESSRSRFKNALPSTTHSPSPRIASTVRPSRFGSLVAALGLLAEFTVSTKVGVFTGGNHSLDPARLRQAIEQSCIDLRHPPGLVLLHNPETSLERLDDTRAPDALAEACGVLINAVSTGLCGGWGISTWSPRPVLAAVTPLRPDVLMTRAGLTVGAPVLTLIEELAGRLDSCALWGMSPFGGDATDPAWREVNAWQFLRQGPDCTDLQAVFRTAYALPEIERVAVGTGDPSHLRALVEATGLEIDRETVAAYRDLLATARPAAR